MNVVAELAHYVNFAVAREGIYYQESPPGGPLGPRSAFTAFTRPEATINFLSFRPGARANTVVKLTRYAGHGLDISPDGRALLFGQMDTLSEDLMLFDIVR